MAYTNVYDFAAGEFEIETPWPARRGDPMPSQREILERASHRMYKHSPNGLGLAPLGANGKYLRGLDNNDPVWGIEITGIVEGTEIEGIRKLMFPFESSSFWDAAQSLANELDESAADWEASCN